MIFFTICTQLRNHFLANNFLTTCIVLIQTSIYLIKIQSEKNLRIHPLLYSFILGFFFSQFKISFLKNINLNC